MAETDNMDYCILRYAPSAVSDQSVPLAVIFTDPCNLQEGLCEMRVAATWQSEALLIDPYCDFQIIEALLTEIRDRLLAKHLRSDMIHQLDDSFSNAVQVSERRKCPGTFNPEICEDLAHELLRTAPPTSPRFSSMRSIA